MDLLLSTVVGGGMALLSYAMLTRQTPNDISSFYLSRALPEGGRQHVVNVMLVDFVASTPWAKSPYSAPWR